MRQPSDARQVRFLADVQRILNEGMFTATYKYALLLSIADLCLVRGDDTDDRLTLATDELAERFIQLYWHHSAPYSPGEDRPAIEIRQNSGAPAAVLRAIRATKDAVPDSLPMVRDRHRAEWNRLTKDVEKTVREMPLTKLQTVGNETLEVLYTIAADRRTVTLLPGVSFCFRRFYTLIRNLVQGAWLDRVRRLNQGALGPPRDLVEFLFPRERASLAGIGPILKAVQGGRCFYCSAELRGTPEVDHFIPWSRYPADLAHNFVLAHKSCNQNKSSHLAAEDHLERWRQRNDEYSAEISEGIEEQGIPADLAASTHIVRWAYAQAQSAGAQVWIAKRTFGRLDGRWRRILLA